MAPHASPSVAPPDSRPTKRPRLSKSTHRVLNVWAQLAERYNKRLDEDDIVDLYSGTIISDRGVLRNGKDYDFGHLNPDDIQDDQDQEQEQEQEPDEQDQDDDVDELDTLPVRRAPDGTMASTSELLRAVPPLSATTDADDLNDFLDAEKRRRELLGDEDGDDDMSLEELAALREALHKSDEEEQPETVDPEHAAAIEDESEDELNSIWQHDEASVVYHIPRNESEQNVAEGEQKTSEFADSDEEFAALLERPPRAGKRRRSSSPSFSLRGSSPSSHRCTSSESTLVPDTPSTTASTRFASHTPRSQVYPFATPSVDPAQPLPRTQVYPFATPSIDPAQPLPRTQVYPFATPSIDPTQPPQLLLYQAMHQLSYALSATMLTYGSPHMPPPPTGPWGAYPLGFAHPWGPQEMSEASHSFKLGDDKHDDEPPDDESTLVDHDGGDRRRSTSPIGSRREARRLERRKSARFYEEKYQDQRIAARGRTPGTPSPTLSLKGSTSTNKKGKAKRKS
ncbi:uncharacterized protein EDB93DRAFT_1247563 [Suillus bovinus]|uniref:uncharacterized protein n=1 Tax=Suillus bovinus TaxID=48563 RepID=UPI001B85E748|nr:uncharacterized protein EDB93DRAFT_1247563 [Suillus bovinus]KAG2155922.1 hypothetical protein EDB93DRAFT_1247563 [Suillus bovinus]